MLERLTQKDKAKEQAYQDRDWISTRENMSDEKFLVDVCIQMELV